MSTDSITRSVASFCSCAASGARACTAGAGGRALEGGGGGVPACREASALARTGALRDRSVGCTAKLCGMQGTHQKQKQNITYK